MVCALLGHNWSRKRILVYCDNLSTVEISPKSDKKDQSIINLISKLTYLTALYHFVIHIAVVENTAADSRY